MHRPVLVGLAERGDAPQVRDDVFGFAKVDLLCAHFRDRRSSFAERLTGGHTQEVPHFELHFFHQFANVADVVAVSVVDSHVALHLPRHVPG